MVLFFWPGRCTNEINQSCINIDQWKNAISPIRKIIIFLPKTGWSNLCTRTNLWLLFFSFLWWQSYLKILTNDEVTNKALWLVYSLSSGDGAKEHNDDSDVVLAATRCRLRGQPLGAHSRLFYCVLDDGQDILVAHHVPQSITCHHLQVTKWSSVNL